MGGEVPEVGVAVEAVYRYFGVERPRPTIIHTTLTGDRLVITAGRENAADGIALPDADRGSAATWRAE
jgi:hypothetical protein